MEQYKSLDEKEFNNALSKACLKKNIGIVGYLLTAPQYEQYANTNIKDNKLLLLAINHFISCMNEEVFFVSCINRKTFQYTNKKDRESPIDMEMINYLIINFNFKKTKKVEKRLAYILITGIKKEIDNLFILGERKRNLEKSLTNKSNIKIINKMKL